MTAANDKQKIHELEKSRHEAMVNADVEFLGSILADEFAFTHSDGARDTKEEYLAKLRDRVFYFSTMEQPKEDILISGDTAAVLGHMTATVNVPSIDLTKVLNNLFLAVWARQNGEWKLLAVQPTPVPLA